MASGAGAFVGGGGLNVASGLDAMVPGGVQNRAAAADSFAAGRNSYAKHSGTFVWSDDADGATQLASSGPNQFLARASGGVRLYSSKDLTTGVALAPGSGSWSTLSDRSAKIAMAPVDDAVVLARLAALPITRWSYRAQGTGVRHVGPMAQDFRAAFGLGEDGRHIATVDEEGVALAAIKALYRENRRLKADDASLRARQSMLERAIQRLAGTIARLEQRRVALRHS